MKMQKKRQSMQESGMMTVEAVLCLVPFILAILGIISFINIYIVHSRIQFALYQTANELSAYTYVYEALGFRSADKGFQEDVDKETAAVDKSIEDLTGLLGNFETLKEDAGDLAGAGESGRFDFESALNHLNDAKENGSAVIEDIRGFVKDPKSLLRGVLYLGAEKLEGAAKGLLIQAMAGGLMEGYLDTAGISAGEQSADEWLEAYGVVDGMRGLDLKNSTMFTDRRLKMIDIVVEYDLEIYFFKLFFKNPQIHVVQRVAVPSWLDGDGVHYDR